MIYDGMRWQTPRSSSVPTIVHSLGPGIETKKKSLAMEHVFQSFSDFDLASREIHQRQSMTLC